MLDLIHGLAGVVLEDAVQLLAHPEDFPGLDVDVGRLALRAAQRLVDQDPRVRQGEPLALGAGAEQERGHEAAWPMQIVEMAGFTYCIVS